MLRQSWTNGLSRAWMTKGEAQQLVCQLLTRAVLSPVPAILLRNVTYVCCTSADQTEELAAQMLRAAYASICKTMGRLTDTPIPSLIALAQLATHSVATANDAQAMVAMQLLAVAQCGAHYPTAQINGETPALAGQHADGPCAAAETSTDQHLPSQEAPYAVMAAAAPGPAATGHQPENGSSGPPPPASHTEQPTQHSVAACLQGGLAADAAASAGTGKPLGGTRKRAAEEPPEGKDEEPRRKRAATRVDADLAPKGTAEAASERRACAAPGSSAAAISSLVSTLEEQVCMHHATDTLVRLMCSVLLPSTHPSSWPLGSGPAAQQPARVSNKAPGAEHCFLPLQMWAPDPVMRNR